FWRSSSLYSVSKSISLTMAMLSSVSMLASVTRQGKSRSSTARSSHAAMRRSVASVREHISVLQCGERRGGRVAMVVRCLRSPGPSLIGGLGRVEGDLQTTVLDKKQLLHNAAPGGSAIPIRGSTERRASEPAMQGVKIMPPEHSNIA